VRVLPLGQAGALRGQGLGIAYLERTTGVRNLLLNPAMLGKAAALLAWARILHAFCCFRAAAVLAPECPGLARLQKGYHAATLRQPIEGRCANGVLWRRMLSSPVFTRRLKELLADDSYAAFQRALAERPDMGDVIEGTGGLRKVRVASSGHGK